MRWRQPNAGLARTRCHQSSWVRRSAVLKHEDLIELTPSPRADGLEHSVNAATDYCKQLPVALIAPQGARQSSAWPPPRGAKRASPGHKPPPNTAPGCSCCTSTPHSCSQGQAQVLFVMFSIAWGGLLNISSFFMEFKLSHLWLVACCHPSGSFSYPVYFCGSNTLCALTDYFEYMKYDLMYSIFISNVFCTSWIGMSQTGVTVNTTAKRFYKLARVSL